MKSIRSRINEFFNEEAINELIKISRNRRIRDNNQKILLIQEVLEKHKIENVLLGPGTNRVAFLIDNYVFKVAMDDWGVRDNNNEMAMSYELQPFVIKVYECNGILAVSEYVTLITEEEFYDSREMILNILEDLSESYLLGDVGYTAKNFTNWGYRDNGDLVILDFAYIYQITTDILRCSEDGRMLAYNDNFTRLRCPHCTRIYEFMEIRKRIPREFELERNKSDLDYCYKVGDKKMIMVDDDNEDDSEHSVKRGDIVSPKTKQISNNGQEEDKMNDVVEEHEDAFERIQRRLMEAKAKKNPCSFEGDPLDDAPVEEAKQVVQETEPETTVEEKSTEEVVGEIDSMMAIEEDEVIEPLPPLANLDDASQAIKPEEVHVVVEKEITNSDDLDLFTELEQKEMARMEEEERKKAEKELVQKKEEENSTFQKHLLSIAEAEEFTGDEFDEEDDDDEEEELYEVRRK